MVDIHLCFFSLAEKGSVRYIRSNTNIFLLLWLSKH